MRSLKAELLAEEEARIDGYLAAKLEISRSKIKKAIKEGKILVNGRPTKPSHILKPGEVISIEIEESPESPEPADVSFRIIYEDSQIIAVDKPSGLTVHPAPGVREPTLVNGLIKIRPEIAGVGSNERPGIVHRLDKDTSGIMLVAKTEEAYQKLQRQFANRLVHKSYIAIVEGHPPSEGDIPLSIGRDPHHKGKFSVGAYSTRKALTIYRKIGEIGDYSVILACPFTGRTHQIRVHLSFIGYPIAGDPVYGKKGGPVGRLALHAYCITFIHPEKGERMELCSEIPPEFKAFMGNLAEKIKNIRFCNG